MNYGIRSLWQNGENSRGARQRGANLKLKWPESERPNALQPHRMGPYNEATDDMDEMRRRMHELATKAETTPEEDAEFQELGVQLSWGNLSD
jgi:hypothetical protein